MTFRRVNVGFGHAWVVNSDLDRMVRLLGGPSNGGTGGWYRTGSDCWPGNVGGGGTLASGLDPTKVSYAHSVGLSVLYSLVVSNPSNGSHQYGDGSGHPLHTQAQWNAVFDAALNAGVDAMGGLNEPNLNQFSGNTPDAAACAQIQMWLAARVASWNAAHGTHIPIVGPGIAPFGPNTTSNSAGGVGAVAFFNACDAARPDAATGFCASQDIIDVHAYYFNVPNDVLMDPTFGAVYGQRVNAQTYHTRTGRWPWLCWTEAGAPHVAKPGTFSAYDPSPASQESHIVATISHWNELVAGSQTPTIPAGRTWVKFWFTDSDWNYPNGEPYAMGLDGQPAANDVFNDAGVTDNYDSRLPLGGAAPPPPPPTVQVLVGFHSVNGIVMPAGKATGWTLTSDGTLTGPTATLRGNVKVQVTAGASDGSQLTVKLGAFGYTSNLATQGCVLTFNAATQQYEGTFDTRVLGNGNNALIVNAWTPTDVSAPSASTINFNVFNEKPRVGMVTNVGGIDVTAPQ